MHFNENRVDFYKINKWWISPQILSILIEMYRQNHRLLFRWQPYFGVTLLFAGR